MIKKACNYPLSLFNMENQS